MSLTQGNDLYAALADSAVNKFLRNVFAARPHYFNYATPSLGGGSTTVGLLTPLMLPGITQGVEYSIGLAQPTIAFYSTNMPPPPPNAPPVPPNSFRFYEKVTWTVSTTALTATNPSITYRIPSGPVTGSFDVWCIGTPVVASTSQGKRIALQPSSFTVNGTGNLDPVFSYFGQLVLSQLLSQLNLPTTLVNPGALSFALSPTPTPNPIIASSQLQIWATMS
jgi:hypothetical protein